MPDKPGLRCKQLSLFFAPDICWPGVPELNGRSDLLERFNLLSLESIIMKASITHAKCILM